MDIGACVRVCTMCARVNDCIVNRQSLKSNLNNALANILCVFCLKVRVNRTINFCQRKNKYESGDSQSKFKYNMLHAVQANKVTKADI